MNKAEVVSMLADKAGFTKADAAKAVEAFIDVVMAALRQGDDVRLIGFGTFQVNSRGKFEARDPRTGKKITIPPRKRPAFKPGKALKDAVNDN